MKRLPALIVALATLTAGGCGDDAAPGSTTTAAPPTTAVPTTTTTSTTTSTTLPGDLHPTWGVSWSAMWQGIEGKVAQYRTEIMGSESMDLAARFEFGVEWRGGTWDRLVIGTVEPGEWGAALYFSRPEPWVLRVWGAAQTSAKRQDVVLEYLAEPLDLDLTRLPGDPPRILPSVVIEQGGRTFGPTPAVAQLESVGVEDVEVAAGTIPGAYHLRLGLGGDFYPTGEGGEIIFFSDLWLHPEQILVKWDPGPARGPIELLIPWMVPEGN